MSRAETRPPAYEPTISAITGTFWLCTASDSDAFPVSSRCS